MKITPAARDSPADAEVWTRLFSSIVEFLKSLSMPIDNTAAGIDADTVIPANRPKYAFAAESITDRKIPNTNDLAVNSNFVLDEFMTICNLSYKDDSQFIKIAWIII